MKKVLIPLTNHATLGNTDEANGTYAPELTHVLDCLHKADIGYDFASIKGGSVPLYGTDIEGDEVNSTILETDDFNARIATTLPVAQVNIEDYDAVFYPGGFGLLSDLAENESFAQLSAKHYEDGGILAAVCHGPAALLPIVLSNGEHLIADKSVTSFTREEEVDYGTINNIPFLLEESLTRKAGKFSKVQPWHTYVIEDNRVITGQNPMSAHAVGEALVKQLTSH